VRTIDLSLNTRRHRHVTTVEVAGEVDPCSGRLLLDYALNVMRDQGPWLVVDLAEVTFMDTAGVETLLAIKDRAMTMGGSLLLVSLPAQVRQLLAIIGLDVTLARLLG
jgi:anti-anti-sigma factor